LAMILSVFCQFSLYHGQRETDKRETISWPRGNWQKKRQYHGLRETDKWHTISWSKVKWQKIDKLSLFCQFPFGHDIVCLLSVSLWPWSCLSFVTSPLAMILSVFCHFTFGHGIVCLLSLHLWYHGQRWSDKRQTISWPKVKWQKTDNNMAKGKLTKDRRQFLFGHDIVCLLSLHLWPWYCLSFVSFPLSLDIVCLLSDSLWPWYCLSFWPKVKWQKRDIIMAKENLTKDRKYHGQRGTDKDSQFFFGHDIVCLLSVSLWPW
jgi:hypothetical protein